ncbi:TPA: IS5 family transposase [Klebsiella pneumoniae]|nr:IS5 family transposase [Klebsiella pneumoniae]MDV0476565.1 IS5 family transposase [Klebsiella pneumoniae]
MAKQKFRITNWSTYNKALINRGSLTFWLDDGAIQAWYESATPSSRGRPQRYSDLAITTVLVIKRVFRLTLRAAQGFIDSIFALMNVPLRCPDYTSVSKRAKSVNVSFKTSTRGEIAHLVIDSTGLKVFGEGEWGCKPEPPKFPSRQFHPCHKGIQINHLAVTLKGIVSVQQNVSPGCRRYLGERRERLGVTCCFALR